MTDDFTLDPPSAGRKAIGSHHCAVMASDTWLTPPEIVRGLGSFDLDPCCPPDMPWRTAARMLTRADNGLRAPWAGRVWLNPPYSRQAVTWLRRLASHGEGTALVFARTETSWFVECVWQRASAVFFLHGRVNFHLADGRRSAANAGAPSVLVAYGAVDAERLRAFEAWPGTFFNLPAEPSAIRVKT